MKEIQLTRGKVAFVDDEDFEVLNQWKWYADKSEKMYYAARNDYSNNIHRRVKMHRFLLGLRHGDNKIVDHIDRNGLNNQKSNIRVVSHGQNMINRVSFSGSVSKFKGVYWHSKNKKWIGQIKINGKQIYLGSFESEKQAAIAYNKRSIELHGEFCKLNEI